MRKIAIFIMTICMLFSLSTQLPAPTEKSYEIVIDILPVDGVRFIDLGEKYAYGVPRGATIKWTSTYDFILQFEGEDPFDPPPPTEPTTKSYKAIEKTIRQDAKFNHLYKYTVFAVDSANKNTPLSLDPVIIIIPPKK